MNKTLTRTLKEWGEFRTKQRQQHYEDYVLKGASPPPEDNYTQFMDHLYKKAEEEGWLDVEL